MKHLIRKEPRSENFFQPEETHSNPALSNLGSTGNENTELSEKERANKG